MIYVIFLLICVVNWVSHFQGFLRFFLFKVFNASFNNLILIYIYIVPFCHSVSYLLVVHPRTSITSLVCILMCPFHFYLLLLSYYVIMKYGNGALEVCRCIHSISVNTKYVNASIPFLSMFFLVILCCVCYIFHWNASLKITCSSFLCL